MGKIVRYEFMGNPLIFWLLCLTGLGIPIAIIYLINGTLRIETDVDDAEEFVSQYRREKSHR